MMKKYIYVILYVLLITIEQGSCFADYSFQQLSEKLLQTKGIDYNKWT